MEGTSSQSLDEYFEDDDDYVAIEEGDGVEGTEQGAHIDPIAEKVQCMTIYNNETSRRGEELSWDNYGLWREGPKNIAARIEKQLKARWQLEELIEEQVNRYHARYNRSLPLTRLKDIPQLLMPKQAPPFELAVVSWFGDWRPSAILDLALVLVHSLPSLSTSFLDSFDTEELLSQLIHEIRIEETVIDEEMAEIQATCILHLPFSPINISSPRAALSCVHYEFKKIERVIRKAQQLRFRALELVLKKVLSQADAAEFVVAFEKIQSAIHQFASNQRSTNGTVTLPVKVSNQRSTKDPAALPIRASSQRFTTGSFTSSQAHRDTGDSFVQSQPVTYQ